MVNSMTGFATLTGQIDDLSWVLEIKSVNARGLDVRMRLSDGGEILEPFIKKKISKMVSRGAVNVFLRTENRTNLGLPHLNSDVLARALEAINQIEDMSNASGHTLSAPSAADVLGVRGVFEPSIQLADTDALVREVSAQIPALINSFIASRAAEGAALQVILAQQIETVATLTKQAKVAAGERQKLVATRLRENLSLIMSQTDGLNAERLEQELALLAVKADISEEIDRLCTHVDAARELLSTSGPIGRKFDFLMQEFNREANTLCSKSGSTELTRIGLELKTVIDQMREQVQNVE